MQVKKQQLESDMEPGLIQNWERSMIRLHIVILLSYLQDNCVCVKLLVILLQLCLTL